MKTAIVLTVLSFSIVPFLTALHIANSVIIEERLEKLGTVDQVQLTLTAMNGGGK